MLDRPHPIWSVTRKRVSHLAMWKLTFAPIDSLHTYIERQDRSTKEMWIKMRCALSARSRSLGIKILSIPVPFHIWSSVNIGFQWYNSLIGYQMDSTDSRTTLDSIVQCFFYIFHGANTNDTTKLVAKNVGLTWMLQSFEASTSAMVINVQITCFRFFHFVF